MRNVPLNDGLARVDTKEGESLSLWKDYLSKWTIWNHIRTLASFAAMVLFILAL
nr:anthrone oxygenase family protein [Heyndrickxia oleronia]